MPSNTSDTYQNLVKELRRLERLQNISGLLDWDEQVNLPAGSACFRAEQNAFFSELLHKEASSATLGRMLEELNGNLESLNEGQKAVVNVATRDFEEGRRLPSSFVRQKAENDSLSYHAWAKARQENNYASFAPMLEKQIETAREQASILGHKNDPYSYWVDHFDPGMDLNTVNELFTPLKEELTPIAARLAEACGEFEPVRLQGFDTSRQHKLLLEVLNAMGFDFQNGRIDTAEHPFCSGNGQDTRITTRYDKNNPLDSLLSAMHEAGHGLYEQGLDDAEAGNALGIAAGMAVHESQSRIWENQVGRSEAFWHFAGPRLRSLFPEETKNVSSEALLRTINYVRPGPVRLDADEVTYNLHILLRFEIEKKLMEGSIKMSEIPEAWNATSKALLGTEPQSDQDGCMQDVHWACGLFGYFPSYAIGNMFAAHLWEKIQLEIPDLNQQLSCGQCRALLDWLRKNVHAYARRYKTNELLKVSCGSKLSHKPLISYIRNRYFPLHHA